MTNFTFFRESHVGRFLQKHVRVALMLVMALFAFQIAQAQVSLTATSGTATGSFTTLKGAFDAINAGTHKGIIIISITGNTTETATAVLNASGSGSASYTNVIIQPSGGSARTISGAITAGSPLIDLSGADNVKFDGLNSGGNSLTISNTTASATSGTCTIRFIGGATTDTITNCSVLGSFSGSVATNGGNIYFATDAVTSNGNDNNIVSNCNIGPAGTNLPTKGIYGNGSTTTTAIGNSGIIISNNNIYDYFGAAVNSAGIYVGGGCTAWTITNNKLYQTSTKTITTGSSHSGIYIANTTSADGFTITGNIIGYASNTKTGTYTIAGALSNTFYGIYLSPLSTSTTNVINSNLISDINFTTTNTGTTAGAYPFCGINLSTSAGTISIQNDTIRNISLPGSGSFTAAGIDLNSSGTGTHTVNNNLIDNITRTASGVIYGIKLNSPTTATFNNNTISNLAINNTSSTSSIFGIYGASSSVNVTCNNNTIYNLTSTSTSTVTIGGIREFGISGNKVFSGNVIYGLSSSGTNATIYGIYASASSTPNPMVISSNTIYNFSGGSSIYAIYQSSSSTTVNIYNNKVYGLVSANASGVVYGVYLSSATTTNVYNNIVGDLTSTAYTSATSPYLAAAGIYVSSGNSNLYNNTVYFASGATSSGTNASYAGIYASTTPTVLLQNNLVVNLATPKGSGKAIAYQRSGTTLTSYSTSSNNNSFYGTSGLFWDGTNNYTTLSAYKTAMSTRDQTCYNENPTFSSTTGSSSTYLHIPAATVTPLESGGVTVASFNTDIDGDSRPGPTGSVNGGASGYDIGADEFDAVPALPSITFNTISPSGNQCSATSRTITVTINPRGTLTGSPVLSYQINSGSTTNITMTAGTGTTTSTGTWTAVIPAATPTNGIVTWTVSATNSTGNKIYTGSSYQDDPTNGISGTATASPSSICAGASTSLSMSFGSTTPPTYTAPPAVTNPTTDEDLGNITITQGATTILNNTTSRNSLIGTIGTATGTAGSYSNFTSFGPYILKTGQSFNFSASVVDAGGGYSSAIGIYIDYNRNGVFTDAGEAVYVSSATTAGAHTETGAFTVPLSASLGYTRMRVVVNEGLVTGPTMTVGYGEYEDYLINLQPNVTDYSWSDGSTTVGSGNPLSQNPITNTTYTCTATISGCPVTSSSTSVAVTTVAVPTAVVDTTTQCGTGTPGVSVSGTGPFKWYTQAVGGTAIVGQTSNTLTGYSISSNTRFYVSQVSGSCESNRVLLKAGVISPDPLSASASATAICQGGSVDLSTSQTGSTNSYTLTWTALPASGSGITGGVAGSLSTPTTVSPTAPGTYVYTITGVDGSCTATNTVSVTVNAAPSITTQPTSPSAGCNTASASLTAAGSNTTGYQWQSSASATGPFANVASGTPTGSTYTGTTTATLGISSLPSTYYFRVVANSAGCTGDTSTVATVTVNNPTITGTTPGTKCGPGTVTLSATGSAGTTLRWYAASTGGTALQTGSSYTTPSISTTTTYYVGAEIASSAVNGTVGAGGSTTASSGTSSGNNVSPFSHYFGGYKGEYLIKATELTAAGLKAGTFNSMSFNVTTAGTTYNGFTLRLGNTAATVISSTYTTSSLTDVYSGNITPTTGTYTIPFSTSFVWDGTSNVVVQFCWSNNNGGGTAAEVKYDATSYASLAYYRNDNVTPATICARATADGTLALRPQLSFNNTPICYGSRTAVTATINTPPAITATGTATICSGSGTALNVSSSVNDPNYTYTWTPGSLVGASQTVSPTTTTKYYVDAVDGTSGTYAGCAIRDSIIITVLPTNPTATATSNSFCGSGSTTISLSPATGLGTATIQWQSSPDSASWTDISGATATTYATGTITTSTYYRALLKLGGTTCVNTNGAKVTINNPAITGTTPGARCGTGTVTLAATGNPGATLNWYTAASGGTSVGTGSPFTTPSISSTTDYWVEASNLGSVVAGARTAPTAIANTTPSSYGLVFDVTSPFILNSVEVFNGLTSSGTFVIQLQNSSGTALQTSGTFTVPAGTGVIGTTVPYTATLGWTIPAGTGYRLLVTSGTASLVRESSLGGFPYALGTNGSITSGYISGTSTTYYYLYNWKITPVCLSSRTKVTATINTAPTVTLSPSTVTICNGSTTTLSASSSNDPNYTYTWSGGLSTGASATTPALASTTTYTVTGTDLTSGTYAGCSASATATVTVVPSSFTATAGTPSFCSSGSTTITLSPATGLGTATIQWQSSPDSTSWADISGATGTTYATGTITSTTFYRAQIKIGGTVCVSSTGAKVSINNPSILTKTPAGRCGTGTVTLGATSGAGATLNWYTAATGGTLLQSSTSTSFTTPSISTTTKYYVSASYPASETVGLSRTIGNTCGTNAGAALTDYPIRFTATKSITINSVYIIPVVTGTVTISLRRSGSSTDSLTVTTASYTSGQLNSPQQVNLNFTVPAGNWQLTNSARLYRISTYTCTYPFTTSDGAFSITGSASSSTSSNSTSQYNSFFDFNVTSSCEGTRDSVTASINTAPAITTTGTNAICSGSSSTLNVSSSNTGYTYTWTPGPLSGATQTISPGATTKYYISAVDASGGAYNGCTANDSVTVTVLPTSVSAAAVNANICGSGGTAINLSPSSGYGIGIIDWQSSPNGSTWTSVASNTTSYVTGSLLTNTYYRAVIRDTARNACTTSNSVFVTVNNPIITSTKDSITCTPGAFTLSATGSSGTTVKWYNALTGGSLLTTGTSYTTPPLSTSTTYYVEAASAGTTAGSGTIGDGASTIVDDYSNPFYSLWSHSQQQILIKADELQAAGLAAGNLTGLSITINSGTTIMKDFSLGIASYANTNTSLTTLLTSGFTTVYTNATGYTPTIGTNTITFSTPFTWDGSSHIVLKFCWGNSASSATMSSTAVGDPTSYVCSVNAHNSSATSGSSICGSTTIYGTYSARPKFTIYGQMACASSPRTPVYAVVTSPTSAPTVPGTQNVCSDSIVTLTASGVTNSTSNTIFNENFNGSVTNWTKSNTGTGGGTPSAADWTQRSGSYYYYTYDPIYYDDYYFDFYSNDTSSFMLSNSDAQDGYTTTPNTTSLTSPSFSTAGYSSASLTFYQNFVHGSNDSAVVQISTDNGSTWTNIAKYTSTQGRDTLVDTYYDYFYDIYEYTYDENLYAATVDLSSYVGYSNVKLRFKYTHTYDFWWAIDNVTVTGVKSVKYAWTPNTNLYTNALATIAYDSITYPNQPTVYVKATDTITYKAIAYLDRPASCSGTNNVTVNVSKKPTANLDPVRTFLCDNTAILAASSVTPSSSTLTWTNVSGSGTSTLSGTPVTVTGLTTGQSIYQLTATNGDCVNKPIGKDTINTSATNSSAVAVSPSPGVSVCNYCIYQDGNTKTYYNTTDGKIIASITDETSNSSALGETEVCFRVDGSVQNVTDNLGNTQPYLQRVWTINPVAGSTATVTLYFTAAELAALQAAANSGVYQFSGLNSLGITKYSNGGTTYTPNYTPPASTGGEVIPAAFSSYGSDYQAQFTINTFSTFYLHPLLYPFGALPVELVSFTGWNAGSVNQLQWKTASEQNTLKFILEKRIDGGAFTYLGELPAAGNSNSVKTYNLSDVNPVIGNNYYRLKMVDADGKFSYSNVINIPVGEAVTNNFSRVYPNPTGGKLNVEIQSTATYQTNIVVYDILGSQVFAQNKELVKGVNLVQFDFSALAKGTYVLHFMDNSGKAHTTKFVKD